MNNSRTTQDRVNNYLAQTLDELKAEAQKRRLRFNIGVAHDICCHWAGVPWRVELIDVFTTLDGFLETLQMEESRHAFMAWVLADDDEHRKETAMGGSSSLQIAMA